MPITASRIFYQHGRSGHEKHTLRAARADHGAGRPRVRHRVCRDQRFGVGVARVFQQFRTIGKFNYPAQIHHRDS